MKKIIASALIFTALSASSCSSVFNSFPKELPPVDYLESSKKMDIKKFFDGEIEGFLMVQGEDGKIVETKLLRISASWDQNKGMIKKNYISEDGSSDNSTWLVTLNSDGTFDSVGHGIVKPVKGRQVGNVAQMIYTMMVPAKDKKEEVFFEERIYLVGNNEAISIANFKRLQSPKQPDNRSYGKIILSLKRSSGR